MEGFTHAHAYRDRLTSRMIHELCFWVLKERAAPCRWVFGFMSTVCFLILAAMLAMWHDKAAENLELQALSRSAPSFLNLK